jgi:hypothetical protein
MTNLNGKIEAIKAHRVAFGSGLMEAKWAVEAGWQPGNPDREPVRDPETSLGDILREAKEREEQEKKVNACVDYRNRMEFPMEVLASTLEHMGVTVIEGGANDDELVQIATRKLNMLYKMVLATGMNEALLKACMEG